MSAQLTVPDEDLSAMYLTSRARGRPRALHDHEQLELLLESFTKQVEEIVSEVDNTVVSCDVIWFGIQLTNLGEHPIYPGDRRAYA